MDTERTVLLGLLGEHISASLTPAMHEAEGRRQGLPLVYRTLDPGEMGLARPDWPRLLLTAQRFGFTGVNVTHPAKQVVMGMLDGLSDDAALLGAVNTVTFRGGRAIGENTDHIGFTGALAAMGIDASSGEVVQIGAGGAGSAVAYALLKAGAPRLTLVDVDRKNASSLRDRLSRAFDASRMRVLPPEDAAGAVRLATGLVNCTPIGMDGVSHRSPVDLAALHRGLWVGDAVYRPLRTTLVRAAGQLGCSAFGGAHMVVGQAVAAFAMFTGQQASHEAMYRTFLDRSGVPDHA
ncbi:shikimate dehydrogenase [Arthrobacter sp. STN4]|uniref:shikimate dehydrogenase n=1 Tax=Arthrobacter sp. STN4 TaxID=2923276 RepID=UPI002119EAA0|nr:shikimate dehydrogenase [Arthrobacter sp. STN4]MCQ9165430.1 shikimate dehydrogenase [Arthrobacter sp. STN4]